jgi:hypothetical protein
VRRHALHDARDATRSVTNSCPGCFFSEHLSDSSRAEPVCQTFACRQLATGAHCSIRSPCRVLKREAKYSSAGALPDHAWQYHSTSKVGLAPVHDFVSMRRCVCLGAPPGLKSTQGALVVCLCVCGQVRSFLAVADENTTCCTSNLGEVLGQGCC